MTGRGCQPFYIFPASTLRPLRLAPHSSGQQRPFRLSGRGCSALAWTTTSSDPPSGARPAKYPSQPGPRPCYPGRVAREAPLQSRVAGCVRNAAGYSATGHAEHGHGAVRAHADILQGHCRSLGHVEHLAVRVLVCLAAAHGQPPGTIRHHLQVLPHECRGFAAPQQRIAHQAHQCDINLSPLPGDADGFRAARCACSRAARRGPDGAHHCGRQAGCLPGPLLPCPGGLAPQSPEHGGHRRMRSGRGVARPFVSLPDSAERGRAPGM